MKASMPVDTSVKTAPPREIQPGQRSGPTRALIIDAAEKMIAKDGVEGVSLRQIRVAIGSANTTVVAYHFGGKEGLIEAIVMERHPILERRRAELLSIARRRGQDSDVGVLLHAIWYPYFELTNFEGRHTYAAFLSSISRTHEAWINDSVGKHFPVELELRRLIAKQLPKSADRFFAERSRIAFSMITTALQCCDDSFSDKPLRARKMFETAMRMATTAMLTP